ncbi:MAG TPA: efflux RND transporter periplasmic adaptor subunit [Daejeonella sp.]|nr:efflux RND transporter periplasmic adaptor subunit [Daejeonella sp.]
MKTWKLIFLLPLLLQCCNNKKEVVKARISTITESVYASGIIKAQQQYQVFSTVNGILQKKYVTEGQEVKKGDPLFLIENQTPILNTENARLALELSQKNASANSAQLQELETILNTAKDKLQNDSIMFFRQKNLWSQNVGSRTDLEQRQLAYTSSKNNYQAALNRFQQAKLQLSTEYQQAQNNLRISKHQEGYYTIRSETDGQVYNILKELGEMVSPQTPIAILGEESNFLLEMQVDEYDIAKTRLGQEVLVTMDSYKNQVFKAEVSKIYPIMDNRSRTFTVEAIFSQPPPKLYPNLTLEANIIIQTHKNALIIPREYLVNDHYVLIKPDKKVKVTTGLSDYKYVEITSGLDTSQQIYKP